MSKVLLIACAALLVSGCAPMSDDRATRALESSGLHNIQLHGMAVFGCDKKDFFRKKFDAVNATGQPVSGVVCGGWLKGATVRFD